MNARAKHIAASKIPLTTAAPGLKFPSPPSAPEPDPPPRHVPSALARFCQRMGLGSGPYLAGLDYDRAVRAYRVAKGLPVPGDTPPTGSALSDAERRAKVAVAGERLADFDCALDWSPALRRLAYDGLEPSPYDEEKLRHGLLALDRLIFGA